MKQKYLDKYYYVRNDGNALCKSIDVHDVFIRKDKIRVFLSYLSRIILLINILLSIFTKDKFSVGSFWGLFICAIFAKFLQYKPVKKESVVIIPSFGVQLETHYWSGRNNRRFIPLEKILKPVLNECVTPVTCYWTLSLILRDENELTLAFQKSRPPLRILIPVWRQLCKATNCEELCNYLDSN
ncbi:hypothetical protein LUZ60_009276 [Juncus effusus]|nr:hypothetical protein LUZ60_009276 [Juncus effusus]